MPVYLLDKNVARKTVEALARIRTGRTPLPAQALCLLLVRAAGGQDVTLYILPQSLHVLENYKYRAEVREFLEDVAVIQMSRYVRRWARRLREHGFTPEDAMVLGLGTFGTNEDGSILGVDAIVTLDRRFVNNFATRRTTLARRLQAMTSQLLVPFCRAALPKLWAPGQVLATLRQEKFQ